MDINELSSIFLIHSSSPLFSASELGGGIQPILNLNAKDEMLEYFEHHATFPVTTQRIFKSLNNGENVCSSFHALSPADNDASLSYEIKSKMPNIFSPSSSTPSSLYSTFDAFNHSTRLPLREIDNNAQQNGISVLEGHSESICQSSRQLNTSCQLVFSHDKSFSVDSYAKNIQPLQIPEIGVGRPLSPPLSNTSGPSSSEKSSLIFPTYLDQEQVIETNGTSICKRSPRFSGDLYKPSFIRGSGSEREGRCELCNPPIWLNLKRSTYWYHMNFTHGISSKTGRPYPDPLCVRASPQHPGTENEKRQVLDAFCRNCKGWISINIPLLRIYQFSDLPVFSYDRSNFSDWFKHLQKCLSSTTK